MTQLQDLANREYWSVSYDDPIFSVGIAAGVDIETGQAVKFDNTKDGVAILAEEGEGFGVAHEGNMAGCELEIATAGGACFKLAEAVVAGDELMSDADGNFIKATSGNIVLGIAKKKGAAGDVIQGIVRYTYKA